MNFIIHSIFIRNKINQKVKCGFEMKSQKKIAKKDKAKQYTDIEIEILLFMSNLLIDFDGNGGQLKG